MLEAGALLSADLLCSSPVWPVQRWTAHRDYSSLDEVRAAQGPSSSRHGLSHTESTAGWRRLVLLDGPCKCFEHAELEALVGHQSEIVQAGGCLQGSGGGARSGWWRSNGRGDLVKMGATTKA